MPSASEETLKIQTLPIKIWFLEIGLFRFRSLYYTKLKNRNKLFSFQSNNSDGNPAIHGLEMVLTEIRGLRAELKEHRIELLSLRQDVNSIISKKHSKFKDD